MNSRRRLIAIIVVVGAIAVGVTFAMTSGAGTAGASGSPFAAVPAVGNIGALNTNPLFTPPSAVQNLPADMRPAPGTVHAFGNSASGWVLNGAVCVVAANAGPGGCFTQFSKPVVLYLWGDATGFEAAGIVPDSVSSIELLTSNGPVATRITGNAFNVQLPVNTSITGEQVTLANGETFVNDDPVSLPHV